MSEKQNIVVMDLEGVLVPEIWIAFSEKTGIPELRRTTRDEPDYDKLMRGRLKILDDRGLGLPDIQEVIGSLRPLDGAKEFISRLREETQVVILSDTFEQFAAPLMKQLGWPTLLCHRLVTDETGHIVDYKLRMQNQKMHAVEALQSLNYRVIAFGDSFNDTAMIGKADRGYLFHAPQNIREQFPQFPAFDDYPELLAEIESQLR